MSDHDFDARLLDLLYGELPPDEAKALQAEVDQDPVARKTLEAWGAVREAVVDLPTPEPDPQVHYDILRAARAEVAPAEPSGFFAWLSRFAMSPAFAGAAAVLVLAVGSYVVFNQQDAKPDSALDRVANAPANEVSASTGALDETKEAPKAEEAEEAEAEAAKAAGKDGEAALQAGDGAQADDAARADDAPAAGKAEERSKQAGLDDGEGAKGRFAGSDGFDDQTTQKALDGNARGGAAEGKAVLDGLAPGRAVGERAATRAPETATATPDAARARGEGFAIATKKPIKKRSTSAKRPPPAKRKATRAAAEPKPTARRRSKRKAAAPVRDEAKKKAEVARTPRAPLPAKAKAAPRKPEAAPQPLQEAVAKAAPAPKTAPKLSRDVEADEDVAKAEPAFAPPPPGDAPADARTPVNADPAPAAADLSDAVDKKDTVAEARPEPPVPPVEVESEARRDDDLIAPQRSPDTAIGTIVADRAPAEQPAEREVRAEKAQIATPQPRVVRSRLNAAGPVVQDALTVGGGGAAGRAAGGDALPNELRAARAARQRGDHRGAVSAYGVYFDRYPRHGDFSRSLFEAAASYEALGNVSQALRFYTLIRPAAGTWFTRAQARIQALRAVQAQPPKRPAADVEALEALDDDGERVEPRPEPPPVNPPTRQ